MIAPATTPPPRPVAVAEGAPQPGALVPTPRVPPSPGDPALPHLLDGLAGLERPAPTARPPRSHARRPSSAGWATATGARSTTKATSSSLSFLKDPKLSIEEKLMRLLAHLNQKWEREMQEKLDRIAAGEKGTTTKSKKSGGVFGSVVSAASGALKAVGIDAGALTGSTLQGLLGKLGGPVLAAAASALGFPALAPALLKIGPNVLGAAAGAVSSAVGGASGSQATSEGGMKDSERQQLVLEIQRITERQKEMFGLVSNILKANHDTRYAIVGNLR